MKKLSLEEFRAQIKAEMNSFKIWLKQFPRSIEAITCEKLEESYGAATYKTAAEWYANWSIENGAEIEDMTLIVERDGEQREYEVRCFISVVARRI